MVCAGVDVHRRAGVRREVDGDARLAEFSDRVEDGDRLRLPVHPARGTGHRRRGQRQRVVFGRLVDPIEVACPQRVTHLHELVLDVSGPRLHHVARGRLAVGFFRLLVRGNVRRHDPKVRLGVEAVVADADVEPARPAVGVVESGREHRVRPRHGAGGRRGAPASDRRHLRQRAVEPGRLTERQRGCGEPRRRRAEADVRRKRVPTLEANGVVDRRQVTDVVDDGVDSLGRAPRHRLATDDVGVFGCVRLPLGGRRRRGRRGTEADAVVIREPQFGVAHPVILHEPLDRVGARGGFLTHYPRWRPGTD